MSNLIVCITDVNTDLEHFLLGHKMSGDVPSQKYTILRDLSYNLGQCR